MNKKKWGILFGLIGILLIAVISFILVQSNKVYKDCYVEAGQEVPASEFAKSGDANASYSEGNFDIHVPGDYPLKVKTGWFSHKVTLHILDTTAPILYTKEAAICLGETCEVDDFVETYADATKVTLAYVENPDFSKPGTQEILLRATDVSGNETIQATSLTIYPTIAEVLMEAGAAFPPVEAFLAADGSASYVTNLEETIDSHVPGDYPVVILVDGVEGTSNLKIIDTVAPVIMVHDVDSYLNVDLQAESFVEDYGDQTQVTFTFTNVPDMSHTGSMEVEIVATDLGGNETKKTAKLTVSEDHEAPVISGVREISAYIGMPVSYKKNVSVTDNCMDSLEFEVDNSKVDLNTPGTYPIVYRAVDASGNEAVVETTITVYEQLYSEEEVNKLADAVLAKIIKEGMSDYQKAEAIFDWIRANVGYINHSDKGNWLQGAYEGLAKKQGDCYVYACTSKILLTRAGIKNMDIEKIPAKSMHYWNLVDFGTGWYHFDTTPRKPDRPKFFVWTDPQMMEYSEGHNLSHNYDHSLYPEVNSEPYVE